LKTSNCRLLVLTNKGRNIALLKPERISRQHHLQHSTKVAQPLHWCWSNDMLSQ